MRNRAIGKCLLVSCFTASALVVSACNNKDGAVILATEYNECMSQLGPSMPASCCGVSDPETVMNSCLGTSCFVAGGATPQPIGPNLLRCANGTTIGRDLLNFCEAKFARQMIAAADACNVSVPGMNAGAEIDTAAVGASKSVLSSLATAASLAAGDGGVVSSSAPTNVYACMNNYLGVSCYVAGQPAPQMVPFGPGGIPQYKCANGALFGIDVLNQAKSHCGN